MNKTMQPSSGMQAGYTFDRVDCPVCGRNLGSNWLVRHLKEVHPEPPIIEDLAEFAHSQWSRWMRYLFSKCELNADGTMTMPKHQVDRWVRQVRTPYAELPENEKESDRKEARDVYSRFIEE